MNLPKRKRIRLENFDYSSCGAYFVTVRIADENVCLWKTVGEDIILPEKQAELSETGEIVGKAINAIAEHYENVEVDKYCIMPDHIYIIILILSNPCGRIISSPTLSTVVGSMKRWVSKQVGKSIWQKSFNDRIIRNDAEYREIWKYIDENPLKQ